MVQNKKSDEKAAVLNAQAITAQDLQLDLDTRVKFVPEVFAVAIRALLQNWRQGTVGCKGRSDVARTGKKPWKQKGTGRARAGTAGSPVWRGGGVAFGPQSRVRTLKVTQKAKKSLFNNLLWNRLDEQRLISLDWTPNAERPKTALAHAALKQAGLSNKKVVLFAAPHDYKVYSSFANLPNVQVLFYDQPNVYSLSHSDYWVVLKQDNDFLSKMVNAWI